MSRLALALAALSVAAGPAAAEVVWSAPPAPPDHGDFWRELVEPHAIEVNQITALVQVMVIQPIDSAQGMSLQTTSDQRTRVLQAAVAKLRYARKLAPENVVVLAQLGRVADELGNTRQAIEALQACIAVAGPDKAGAEVTGRLGMIYLRTGELDAAIRYLRLAQGPVTTATGAEVLIDLSTALAMRGEMSDATDVLASALPATLGYSPEQWGVAFALAVQYDRDDQRGAAFAELDKLQGVLADNSYAASMQGWLSTMHFTPAEDEHYFSALLYESLGDYTEARADWALYAASGGAFRARALEHVAAIDEERREQPGAHQAQQAVPVLPPVHMHRPRRHP